MTHGTDISSSSESAALQSSEELRELRESRSRRLRPRRIRVADLNVGEVVARGRHRELGPVEGSVEDLSLHGFAMILHAGPSQASMIFAGDRLEQVVIECAGGILYEGAAIVRRASDRADDVLVGLEVAARAINLGELYRRGARHSFAERLHAVEVESQRTEISTAFKAFVADLRGYLATMQQFLNEEELSLAGDDLLTRELALQQYLEEAAPQMLERLNRASRELAALVRDLPDDQHPAHRAYLRTTILPFVRCSPLLRRSYEKPLGYAGDYEMMNMLYRNHGEGETLFGRVLNLYAAQEGAARANINRIDFLGERIRRAIAECRSDRLRVASIGCGPAREISALLETSPELGRRLDVALIDQEDRSIAYCEKTLGPLAVRTNARIQFIRESIRRLLTAKRLSDMLGCRDLIYSAGLFDYLNQRSFGALLGCLYEALVSGGRLLVGNVSSENPSRWMMEYWLDWFLIHRSPAELDAFAKGLTPAPSKIEIESEPLHLNLFLSVVK